MGNLSHLKYKLKKTRRVFSSDFKSKVVLESLKEGETLAVLVRRFEIHHQQITDWKQQFLLRVGAVFGDSKKQEQSDSEQEVIIIKFV